MSQPITATRTCTDCSAMIVEDEQQYQTKPKKLPFTADGCRRARRYLSTKQISPDPGLTGWEIVGMANDLIEEDRV